jgi:S1-C subfamily serine protease
VVDRSPAEDAGIQGSTGTVTVDGVPIPVGGDVIIGIDGSEVPAVDDLLTALAFKEARERSTLAVLRDGVLLSAEVTLAPRPGDL